MCQCWVRDQRCRDQDQAQTESPIDIVHMYTCSSRPRQGKVEIKTGLEPNTGMCSKQRNILKKKQIQTSAVYTGIKKPESFSHSGFSLKVARQLPLNTPKNPNRKTHLRSVIFWNSAEISLVFCQCKRSLQSRRYYSGFWSRGTWPSAESPDRGPRRNAHYTCTVKGREKSRMRTT